MKRAEHKMFENKKNDHKQQIFMNSAQHKRYEKPEHVPIFKVGVSYMDS